MIGYKLFRKRKDGSLGPLFINRKQRLVPNTFYFAEAHHTKGYAFRPGWHICAEMKAPHLRQGGDRVWAKVEFDPMDIIKRPESQGGTWYLGTWINILEVYDEAEEFCSKARTA
jgi:hypothetical protein